MPLVHVTAEISWIGSRRPACHQDGFHLGWMHLTERPLRGPNGTIVAGSLEDQSKLKIGSRDPGRAVTEAMQSVRSPGTGIVTSQDLVKSYIRPFLILTTGCLHIVRHSLTVMLAMIHLI